MPEVNERKVLFDIREALDSSFEFHPGLEKEAEPKTSAPEIHPNSPQKNRLRGADTDGTEKKPYGIIVLGAILIAVSSFTSQGFDTLLNEDARRGEDGSKGTPEDILETELGRGQLPNPKLTFYEKHFCRGNRTAIWCHNLQDRFYHPTTEVLESLGVTYEEYLERMGREMPEMGRSPKLELRHNRFLKTVEIVSEHPSPGILGEKSGKR